MADRSGKNSKQLILDTATQVFAEKGFDGARVDEIARRANVNKALIYYYFESKDKILEELMVVLVREMTVLKDQLVNDLGDISITEYFENVQSDAFTDPIFKFVKNRKLLLQIIMSEALKDGPGNAVFFQMIDLVMEDGVRRLNQMKGQIRDYEEFSVTALFFSFIPLLNFVSIGEKLAEHKNMDYEVLEDRFFTSFKDFYKNYFINEIIRQA